MGKTYIKVEDRVGQRFGFLVINGLAERRDGNCVMNTTCDCGKECTAFLGQMIQGRKLHCGCRSTQDGRSKTVEYGIWRGMLERCQNPKSSAYRNYGGRGIKVCDRWQDFRTFLADMGPRPSNEHSIDRTDPNRNYEPDNCKWVFKSQQGKTKRPEFYRNFTVCGVTMYSTEWAEVCCITRERMRQRFKIYSPEEAVCTYSRARQWLKEKHGIENVPVFEPRRKEKPVVAPVPEEQLPSSSDLLAQATSEPEHFGSRTRLSQYDDTVRVLLAKGFKPSGIIRWFADRGINYGRPALTSRIKVFGLNKSIRLASQESA